MELFSIRIQRTFQLVSTCYHFYLNGEGCQSFAEQSFAFMEFVCSLKPGTTLYIGGVIDYHF